MTSQQLRNGKPKSSTDMESRETQPRKTRARRRVPGSDTPPRVSLALRMEQHDHKQMVAVLKNSQLSRNDFICGLITAELAHLERFRMLNIDKDAPRYLVRQTERRVKTERRKTEGPQDKVA